MEYSEIKHEYDGKVYNSEVNVSVQNINSLFVIPLSCSFILNDTKILYRSNNKLNLQLVEAYLIRLHNPAINKRDEGITKGLFIF